MNATDNNGDALRPWVAPQIEVLNVRETAARPGIGADVGGNLAPDCQRS
jgi:hypothetical protein